MGPFSQLSAVREQAGGGGLADAARPAEQVGVRDAIELDRVRERADDVLLAGHVVEGLRALLAGEDEVAHGRYRI